MADSQPDRRKLAEAVLQAALRDAYVTGDVDSIRALRAAFRVMRCVRNPDGTERYSRAGLIYRAKAVLDEILETQQAKDRS